MPVPAPFYLRDASYSGY